MARNRSRVIIDTDDPGFEATRDHLYLERDAFWQEVELESDRGFVLIAVAHFESKLEQCLLEFLMERQTAGDLLNPNGPLGTFSAKLKCCLCLGIIEKQVYEMLRRLAQIRNAFAHEVKVDLNSAPVREKVRSLFSSFGKDSVTQISDESVRGQLSIACLLIEQHLFPRHLEVAIFRSKIPDYVPTYISNPDAT